MKRKGKKAKLNNSQRRRRRRRDGRVGRAAGQSQGLKRERDLPCPMSPQLSLIPPGLTILCNPGTESFPLHLAAALILTVFI